MGKVGKLGKLGKVEKVGKVEKGGKVAKVGRKVHLATIAYDRLLLACFLSVFFCCFWLLLAFFG